MVTSRHGTYIIDNAGGEHGLHGRVVVLDFDVVEGDNALRRVVRAVGHFLKYDCSYIYVEVVEVPWLVTADSNAQ